LALCHGIKITYYTGIGSGRRKEVGIPSFWLPTEVLPVFSLICDGCLLLNPQRRLAVFSLFSVTFLISTPDRHFQAPGLPLEH